MTTPEQNVRMTRVGPGTPCGELLRRYWQPLCGVAEVTEQKPKKRIRILGEDLVVYRTPDGNYGCIEEQCAHRHASLYYGFVEPGGIRCCYHGWKFDAAGQCVERPFELSAPRNIRLRAYPVRALGGLLFAYMGPDPEKAPLLPHWDVLVRTDGPRKIRMMPVHRCNWLQIQENTADNTHTYYLHGHLSKVYGLKTRYLGDYYHRPIIGFDWSPSEWGIEKSMVYGGDQPEEAVWPPLIFPNVLRVRAGPVETIHWRVPIDDTNTRVFWVGLMPTSGPEATPMSEHETVSYMSEDLTPEGDHDMSTFYSQDRAVFETQGPIFDRSREVLGRTDKGIVMLRRMLLEQIQRVEDGGEPIIAVVRDPEKNKCIAFPEATRVWVNVAAATPESSGAEA